MRRDRRNRWRSPVVVFVRNEIWSTRRTPWPVKRRRDHGVRAKTAHGRIGIGHEAGSYVVHRVATDIVSRSRSRYRRPTRRTRGQCCGRPGQYFSDSSAVTPLRVGVYRGEYGGDWRRSIAAACREIEKPARPAVALQRAVSTESYITYIIIYLEVHTHACVTFIGSNIVFVKWL